MSGHTKGPWMWSPNDDEVLESVNGLRVMTFGDCYPHSGVPGQADARLIAAAPDLLEALELADAALSGANMNMSVVQRKVKAAIARVKGEQP